MENDTMIGVDDNREPWNHCCHYCESDRLVIHPVGVAFKNNFEDINDLPLEVQDYYSNLPNIVEATEIIVKQPKNGRISMECLDCKNTWNGFWNERPNMPANNDAKPSWRKLKNYLKKFYGVEEMMRL